MKYKKLIISKSENNLILDLLNKVYSKDAVHQNCYRRLREELLSAEVVHDTLVPTDVVRLYSFVDVYTPFGYIDGYQLVLPRESNQLEKKLSILSPMGAALIGYAEGDEVLWTFPKGESMISIKSVYGTKAPPRME